MEKIWAKLDRIRVQIVYLAKPWSSTKSVTQPITKSDVCHETCWVHVFRNDKITKFPSDPQTIWHFANLFRNFDILHYFYEFCKMLISWSYNRKILRQKIEREKWVTVNIVITPSNRMLFFSLLSAKRLLNSRFQNFSMFSDDNEYENGSP